MPDSQRSGPPDPIAIVGMACRLPGASDVQALWQLLRRGGDAIGEAPAERWGADVVRRLHETGSAARHGAFLDRVDLFDAGFFEVSPNEAAQLDPQQRLTLELAWECLEDAGIVPAVLSGSGTGVFMGASSGDYAVLESLGGEAALSRHSLTGLNRGLIANRVSFALGLQGPSLSVDTGQSSSAVAVHLACESLASGECTVALAGGVSLNLTAAGAIGVERFGALSPAGRCYTFDARADGYVRGEGGAMVVLKPLSRAQADGDRVYCVIRGSAVNNDGAGAGAGASLTVPDAAAQEQVVRSACARAGVDPGDVQYVELHGTGTRVGDPVEAAAVGAALGTAPGRDRAVLVGSVKTNVGHLEAAAGITGLVKAALSVRHRLIPPSLNFETANPAIPLGRLNLQMQQALGPWPDPAAALLAGVSSFGIGGTNCHLVIGEPESVRTGPAAPVAPARTVAWPLAGKDRAALRSQAARLRAFDSAGDDPQTPSDVGFSLAGTRTAFAHRAVIIATDRPEFDLALDRLARGEPASQVVEGDGSRRPGRTVFVFPGQGSQWAGMAGELLADYPVFRDQALTCADALAEHLDWSPIEVLRAEPGAPRLDRDDVVQPVLFTVMVSLAALWRSVGVHPDAVLGHSQGELAAAHVAGALSLTDAARIVVRRSRLVRELAGRGGLLAVAGPADQVSELLTDLTNLTDLTGRLTIGAINGPRSTVVGGDPDALGLLRARCTAAGLTTRVIAIDYASHSAQIEPLRERLLDGFADLAPAPGDVTFFSTVTGGPLGGEHLDTGYWYRNLRQTVLFDPAVRALLAAGHGTFIEMSPHPQLTTSLAETIDSATGPDQAERQTLVVGSLRRGEPDGRRILTSMAQVHTHGGTVDWVATAPVGRRVALPTYAFQRRSHWLARGSAVHPADRQRPPTSDRSVLSERLAQLAGHERHPTMLELLGTEIAALLGHSTARAVDPRRTFRQLGFDSLAGLELRERLERGTGLRLAASMVFDHPTPDALATHLLAQLLPELPAPSRDITSIPARGIDDDPVAVVGVGCRFPGGVRSMADLWDLVAAGREALSPFPADRGWPAGGPVAVGGFLSDAGGFDPGFFGVSPREAIAMDPQQRVLLEVAWEAVEDAGIDPVSLRGQPVGVFAGLTAQEYGPRWDQAGEGVAGYVMTGTTPSVASGRIAYCLGLTGPAITVDTACSSSLVAIHLARRSLLAGETALALAGGVTVLATPGIFTEFAQQKGLAADGRCKPFSAAADGTGWGEGAGVLVLERLSDAQRNGHPVLALIRGSAVNQDGASNGLTAPNGTAQEQVIRQALADAAVPAGAVDAVEAHGTGTVLGDPLEARALIAAYGSRPAARPLWIGSIKSNIAHPQAAAGVAGVIKMIAAMRHGVLPRTLHCTPATEHVDWASGPLALLSRTVPWPRTNHPRRAGVSSFGISGTNGHLILEHPGSGPNLPNSTRDAESAVPLDDPAIAVWPLSARSTPALRELAARLGVRVRAQPTAVPALVGHSLATTRTTAFSHRAVLLGHSTRELLDGLAALADGRAAIEPVDVEPADVAGVICGVPDERGRITFVFPGQGSQRLGMGKMLSERFPVFAEALEAICDELDRRLEVPLRSVMFAERGSATANLLKRTDFTQAALFAYQSALFRLLEVFGVRPDYLIGHSIGELTAAHVSGVLDLADACTLIVARGRLMRSLPEDGAMVAIHATEAELRADLNDLNGLNDPNGRVSLAALNADGVTVISGDRDRVLAIAERWTGLGRRTSRLSTRHAYHSAHTDAILAEFRKVAERVEYHPPGIPIISTLTGEPATPGQLQDAAYWTEQIRRPVRFAAALRRTPQTLAYLELSSRATLTAHVHAAHPAPESPLLITSATGADQDEERGLLETLARLHCRTASIDWTPAHPVGTGTIPLPSYPFQHRTYWHSAAAVAPAGHPLLGSSLPADGTAGRWFAGTLAAGQPAFIAEHRLLGTPVMPASGMVEWALAAARSDAPAEATWALREVAFHELMPFPDERRLSVQAIVENDGNTRRVRCFGYPPGQLSGQWTGHVTVGDATALPALPEPPVAVNELRADLAERPVNAFYQRLAELGLEYGPSFRAVRRLWQTGDDAVALIEVDDLLDDQQGSGFQLDPAVLDACFQTMALFLAEDAELLWLPAGIDEIVVHDRLPGRVYCQVRWRGPQPTGDCAMDLGLFTDAGRRLVTVTGLRLRAAPRAALARICAPGPRRQQVEWLQLPASSNDLPAGKSGSWLVFSADQALAGRWSDELGAALPVTADPSSEPELSRFFTGLRDQGRPVAGLILHGGSPASGRVSDPASVIEITYALAQHSLLVVKHFLRAFAAELPEVVICSLGAEPVGRPPNEAQLAQSVLTGLAKAVLTEHPDLRCVQVDLDPDDAEPAPAAILARVGALAGSAHLAVRDGDWFEARLREHRLPAGPQRPIRVDPEAAYLITGGLGGLGLATAGRLADAGARALVLVGRTLPTPEPPALATLRARGIRLEIGLGDVADPGWLTPFLARVRRDLPPVRGIVHAAGVLHDLSLDQLSWDRFAEVLDPKVRGGWLLDQSTRGWDLDFFVLFSSVGALIGSPGQANYLAANTFLDALAQYRHGLGLPATSIGWGPWADTGMAGEAGLLERLTGRGLEPLATGEALDAMSRVLAGPDVQVGIARLDWRRIGSAVSRAEPYTLLAELLPVGAVRAEPSARPRHDDLARQVLTDPVAARRLVVGELLTQVAQLLHLTGPDRETLGVTFGQTRLNRIGLDSLTTVQLRSRLLMDFSVDVPPDVLFSSSTADDVAELICQQLTLRSLIAGDDLTADGPQTEVLMF